MIAQLIRSVKTAIEVESSPSQILRHLEGISAIMESHFRFEERQLIEVLETLELDDDPGHVLGSL